MFWTTGPWSRQDYTQSVKVKSGNSSGLGEAAIWAALSGHTPFAPLPQRFQSPLVFEFLVQSTLVISKLKGPSETLRDIRTSTYQTCSIEEKATWTTKIYKWLCNLTPLIRNIIENIVDKGKNCSPGAISPLFHSILSPDFRFLC